ncbi:hypothetical protein BJ742DRAFT_450794 [Cladochytrium replicatum]|nr:hypothetical protein BJ742DRAFT_450794 [Cladochytrium replicatum]
MSNAAKGAFRGVKNMVKGYTDVQVKVRNATSNEPAGPSTADMADIAVRTEDPRLFMEIMEILDKRLNDNGKQWRHVYKSLILLDFLLHYGSDNVVNYAKENLYIVKTLKEFQYIDEDGRDQGANVRQKSKEITALLADENKLREARRSRGSGSGRRSNSPGRSNAGDDYYNEDAEIRKALEESRRTAALEERSRQASRVEYNDTDADLALALELSREEDEVRKRSRDNIDLFASIDAPQPLLQVQPYQNGQGTDPFALFAASQAQELLAAQQLQQQQLLQQQMETARQLQLQQAMKNQQILAEQERAAREALERAAREAAEKQARELAAAQAAFGLVDDGTRLRDLKNTNVQLDPFANFPRNQTPALIAQPTGSTLNPFGGTPAPSIPAPTPDPFSGFTSGGSTGAFSNPVGARSWVLFLGY